MNNLTHLRYPINGVLSYNNHPYDFESDLSSTHDVYYYLSLNRRPVEAEIDDLFKLTAAGGLSDALQISVGGSHPF